MIGDYLLIPPAPTLPLVGVFDLRAGDLLLQLVLEEGGGAKWHEVARPQVHGHDLTCVTALPGHRFASGADEKIVRVFESTKMFLRNLASITGASVFLIYVNHLGKRLIVEKWMI